MQAQVPIVPVVCENYHRLFDGRSRLHRGVLKIKGVCHLWVALTLVLPPISTKGKTSEDVSKLAEETRDLMLKTLVEISAPGEASKPIKEVAPLPSEVPVAVNPPSALKTGSETTEDEMDDDAVVIKRPE